MDSIEGPNDQIIAYEAWLRLIAGLEIESRFQAKFAASDAVQQTMLEAWRNWDQFRGESELQRRAWLRQILAFQLAKLARHYAGTQKRNIANEVSIDASLARTSIRLTNLLPANQSTPSEAAMANEQSLRLANALDQLPEDYRQVIILRNIDDLPHEEIAIRMDRSVGAVKMLWMRALAALRQSLET
jgi:RNA polymerase sigma-70 factor (ECF subfamily)